MNKKHIYLICLILLFFSFKIFSIPTKTYTNYVLGFKFNYPANIELYNHTGLEDDKNMNHKFKVSIDISNIDELNSSAYADKDYGKEFDKALKEKEFIIRSKEEFKKISYEHFKYKNKIIGQIASGFSTPKPNQIYSKILKIKIKNYFVFFGIDYFDFRYSIPDRYPQYFEREEYEVEAKKKGGGMEKIMVKSDPQWKEPIEKNYVEFYNLIKNKSKKAPQELVKLWEYFDVIINSLELFEPVKYVTPSVKKLSLRKGSSTNDERIRLISQGEKLEVLNDINPPELIGKDYGFWVKVKTEKGEIGWCFDAYLKEVKKK